MVWTKQFHCLSNLTGESKLKKKVRILWYFMIKLERERENDGGGRKGEAHITDSGI